MKLDEGGLARVVQRAKDKSQSHATISAERGDKSKKENKSRSKQLEKDLRGRGYGPKKTTGTYSEKDDKTGEEKKVKERSYFVTSGKKSKRRFKKDMKKVAAKHNQDSVLVKQKGTGNAKLHATRKGGLGKSKSETAGKLKAKKGEFSTQVGKKHMTYEETILAKAEMVREQQIREGVLNQLKKGTKRHKDAVEKKKIKNRKAVPYAALAAGYEPEGEILDEAERKLADRLHRKRKLYDKTTKKAMQFARDEGEASGHARYRMSSISREMDGIRAKMKKEGVETNKVEEGIINNLKAKVNKKLATAGRNFKGGSVSQTGNYAEKALKEGEKYGLYKGDGKPKGAAAAFVKKKKEKKCLDELKFGEKGKTFFYNDPKGRRETLKKTGKDPGYIDGAKEYTKNKIVPKAKELGKSAVKAAKSVAAPAAVGGVVGGATGPEGKKVEGAIGGGSGAAVGAKVGAAGGPVGAAIGSAVGGTVGALVATGGKAKKSKKEGYSDWRSDEALMEKVGGSGTLVRQGIKVGGKKGGKVVQKGTTAATKAGKAKVEKAKQGSAGAGTFEKTGATVGGIAGGTAGFFVPDGPAMVAGEIAGGIVGAKVGGKLGKGIDQKLAKKPTKVKKENMMYQHPFGKFSGMV